jgi:hypothetical protein
MNKYYNNTKKNIITTFNIPINEESKDKLFSLATSLNLSELEEFITTNSISLHVKNNNNQSIIHVMLNAESTINEEELLRCIKFLVERGAPISSIDNFNQTPIFICIKKNYSQIFKYLLDNNASLDINTYDDITPMHIICHSQHETYNRKSIENLIPEKIPKIKMEKYKDIYDKIKENIDLKIFNDIVKEFYVDDKKEDYDNTLLIEELKSNPEEIMDKKKEIFLKLKEKLSIFYTSDEIEEIDVDKLKSELKNIGEELFKVLNFETDVDEIDNAIKLMNYYIEIIKIFFNITGNFKNIDYQNLSNLYLLDNIYDEKKCSEIEFKFFDYYKYLSPEFINYIIKKSIDESIAFKEDYINIIFNDINYYILPDSIKSEEKNNKILFPNIEYEKDKIYYINTIGVNLGNIYFRIPQFQYLRIPGQPLQVQVETLSPQFLDIIQLLNSINNTDPLFNLYLSIIPLITTQTPAPPAPPAPPQLPQRNIINHPLNDDYQHIFGSSIFCIQKINNTQQLPPGIPIATIKLEQNLRVYYIVDLVHRIKTLYNILKDINIETEIFINYNEFNTEFNNFIRTQEVSQPHTAGPGAHVSNNANNLNFNNNNYNLIDIIKKLFSEIKNFLSNSFNTLNQYNNDLNPNILYNIIYDNNNLYNYLNYESNYEIVFIYYTNIQILINCLPIFEYYINDNILFRRFFKNDISQDRLKYFIKLLRVIKLFYEYCNIFNQNNNDDFKRRHLHYYTLTNYNNFIIDKWLLNENNLKKLLPNTSHDINNEYHNNSNFAIWKDYLIYIKYDNKPIGSLSYINKFISTKEIYFTSDFFNLLYTFNNNVIVPLVNINDIFKLYNNIHKIHKFKYAIYIFNKEKKKILNLKEISNNDKELNNLFDICFKKLESSIDLLKQKFDKIQELSNQYIDLYNKINAYDDKSIGIYPKINFIFEPSNTLKKEIFIFKYINNYNAFNINKFFHLFVLYFQNIGEYDSTSGLNTLFNTIIKDDFTIDFNIYKSNNKNKIYKLYFYEPNQLKREKEKIIDAYNINDINIPNNDIFNSDINNIIKDKIIKAILNEIIENYFDKLLTLEINNFFKTNFSLNDEELIYDEIFNPPNITSIILNEYGFNDYHIPNHEIVNNNFISITNNRFLTFTLYFDTNYFNSNNLKTLKYYKFNNFIKNLLDKNKSLILKTDIKGWTPIYYAIDSNNYHTIKILLDTHKHILYHYDHKELSPLMLCINKQLNHLNYLLDDKDEIYFLKNYQKMLRNELSSNNLLIPLNIDSIFTIALFIQNHIWLKKNIFDLKTKVEIINSKSEQNLERNKAIEKINFSNEFEKNDNDDNLEINQIEYNRTSNEYEKDNDTNTIFKKYYKLAKDLEKQDFGYYGSYWKKYKENSKILIHINLSINIKEKLIELKSKEKSKLNLLFYEYIDKKNFKDLKNNLEYYLKFINIRFHPNTKNTYKIFMDKIYVHVLALIIGLDFYLKIEELVIKHYIDLNIFSDTLKNNLERELEEKKRELEEKKTELEEKKTELEKKKTELEEKKDNIYSINLFDENYQQIYQELNKVEEEKNKVEEDIKKLDDEIIKADKVVNKTIKAVKLDKNKDDLKQTLLTIKRKLINNKLEDNNLNYQYISTEKNPENVIKELKESLKIFIDSDEIINTFETKLYPYYRDLYRITFKYLQMFMSNYHKFIYNQYHGLNILLLLLDKISS